jgi:hypothetical protein
MQTLEFILHVEGPLTSDTIETWILYGGPTLVHIWSPEELQGTCAGLELGGELRRYFIQPLTGPFMGAYFGAGALWRLEEETVEAVSAGAKLGWRIPMLHSDLRLYIEPYSAICVKLFSIGEEYEEALFDGTLFLGMKLDFL